MVNYILLKKSENHENVDYMDEVHDEVEKHRGPLDALEDDKSMGDKDDVNNNENNVDDSNLVDLLFVNILNDYRIF